MTTENIIPFERRLKVPAAPKPPTNVEPGLGDVLRDYAAKGHRKAEMPMEREDPIGDLMDIMEEVAAAGWHLSEVGEGVLNGRPALGFVFRVTEQEPDAPTSESQAHKLAAFRDRGADNSRAETSAYDMTDGPA